MDIFGGGRGDMDLFFFFFLGGGGGGGDIWWGYMDLFRGEHGPLSGNIDLWGEGRGRHTWSPPLR